MLLLLLLLKGHDSAKSSVPHVGKWWLRLLRHGATRVVERSVEVGVLVQLKQGKLRIRLTEGLIQLHRMVFGHAVHSEHLLLMLLLLLLLLMMLLSELLLLLHLLSLPQLEKRFVKV